MPRLQLPTMSQSSADQSPTVMTRAKTELNHLIAFLANIYAPSPRTGEWSRCTYLTPTKRYASAHNSWLFRGLSAFFPSSSRDILLNRVNRVQQFQSQPQLLEAPSTLILNLDLDLDEITIVASRKTAKVLVALLGDEYNVVADDRHSDEMLSMGPEMCNTFIADSVPGSITVYESQCEFDFEWATRDFPSPQEDEESPLGSTPKSRFEIF